MRKQRREVPGVLPRPARHLEQHAPRCRAREVRHDGVRDGGFVALRRDAACLQGLGFMAVELRVYAFSVN
jgi:hypothetical protein